jgi:hypothetical protein
MRNAAGGMCSYLFSTGMAIMRAETLARTAGNICAVAFSRTGDPGSGEFADAVMLKAFGKVPNDFGLR